VGRCHGDGRGGDVSEKGGTTEDEEAARQMNPVMSQDASIEVLLSCREDKGDVSASEPAGG